LKLSGTNERDSMSDMQFNHHTDVTPPAIPKKNSKQLIFGILLTLAMLGAIGYGYEAGLFKPEKSAAADVHPD
jgi:hypothetical protein